MLNTNTFLNGFLVQASWVDPDTAEEDRSTRAYTRGDDRKYQLVRLQDFSWSFLPRLLKSHDPPVSLFRFLCRFSPTNSTKTGGLSTMVMIHDGLPLTKTIVSAGYNFGTL